MASKKAFDAATGTTFVFDPKDVVIRDDPEHPRYDPRGKLAPRESLVKSILLRGVILPIKIEKGEGGEAIVVDGRQRVLAAREANRRLEERGEKPIVRVRAEKAEGDDAFLYGVMVAANEHRTDDDFIAKARKVQKYLTLGGTPAEAAVDYGVSEETIRDWLKLLDLDPKVQQMVIDSELAPSAAIHLSTLPAKQQVDTAATLKAGGGKPTVARTRSAIRSVKSGAGAAGAAVPPTKTQLRALVQAAEDKKVELADEDVAILKWTITGDDARLPGLQDALKKLDELRKVAPKRRKKDAPALAAEAADGGSPAEGDGPVEEF